MKLLKITFLFLSVISFGQSKVGTVDVDYILSQMPELAGVQTAAQAYGQTLEVDLKKKVAAFELALEQYKKDEATMTVGQKKTAQDSLVALETDINKFRQNGNKLIGLKNDELMQPLYEKAGIALEKVAKAQAYTQVLLRNNDVVFADNNFDITLAVLKELGVEVKEGQ